MRILKIIAGIGGAVLVVIIAALAWLLLVFDANHYKPEIERMVQAQTGRALQLQGDIHLSFWPSLALSLGKTTLGNAPGYGTDPMLTVEQVRLGVKVWPLLRGRVQVEAIELDAPRVWLTQRSDTDNNWADLGSQATPPEPESTARAEQADSAGLAVSIERLVIRDGQVVLEDQVAQIKRSVSQLSLTTGPVQLNQPVAVTLRLLLQQAPLAQADATTDAKVAAVNSAANSTIEMTLTTQVEVDVANERYALMQPVLALVLTSGNAAPRPINIKAQRVHADLKSQTAALEQVTLDAGVLKAALDAKAERINETPIINGQLVVEPLAIREFAKAWAITLPTTRDPKALQRWSLQTPFVATRNSIELTALTMALDDTTLKGSVLVPDLEHQVTRFDLQLDRINVDRYLEPVSAQPDAAAASDSTPVNIPSESIRGLDVQGQLSIGEAIVSNVTLTAIKMGLAARQDQLQLSPLAAKIYDGTFQGEWWLDASTPVPRLRVTETVQGVNFAPLFKALYKTDRISGHGNVALKLTGAGADSEALKRTLNGTVEFSVNEGAYVGTDLWWEIRRARALLRQQVIPDKPANARTAFTALKGSGVITNGVLSNQDLTAALQYLKVTGQGRVDLVQQTIDYKLQTAVLKFPSEARLAAGNDSGGEDMVGLTVPITITGALTDPKVRPDVTGMLKERAQQELDKQKQKAEEKLQQKIDQNKDKLKEQLQNKLKGLLGG